MMISDLPVREMGTRSGNKAGTVPIVIIVDGNVVPEYTWRGLNDTLPKGQVRGIGFFGVEYDPNHGCIVPTFVEVDTNLFLNWRTIKWQPHEINCTAVGIHYRNVR